MMDQKTTIKSFFSGFGGQGIISLGQIWAYFAMEEGKYVTCFPFYGAEKRGGIARTSVIISNNEIDSPLVSFSDLGLAMNSESLPVCEKIAKSGSILVINSTLVKENPRRGDIKIINVEATGIAVKIGDVRIANMVALGALAKVSGALKLTDTEAILKKFFPPEKHKFVPMNAQAIKAGYEAV